MNWKKELADALGLVSEMGIDECYASLCQPKGGQADWCSTLAFSYAKKNKQNPTKIAAEWAAFDWWPEFVNKVEPTGPYLNFHFTKEFWGKLLEDFESGRKISVSNPKRIIVEFPSVNPNKPWHVGHLRNAILGDSIARVLESAGHEIYRLDYIDDLGLQVAQSYWGKMNMPALNLPLELGEIANKADHVCGWQYVEVSKKFEDEKVAAAVRAVLKEMEDGNNQTSKNAREFAELVVRAQYQTAFSLGIYHDALVFESDIMRTVFEEGIEKIKKSGALVFEQEGKNKGCWVIKLGGAVGFEGLENADKILIRSDGTVTYTGKDVAFQMWKFGILKNDFEYCKFIEQPNGRVALKTCSNGEKGDFGRADMVVNVIGVEQSYPQKAIGAVLQKMGYSKEAENSVHLAYEHVVLPEGRFSGRKGTWMKKETDEIGFSADELIEEVVKRAYERITAEYSEEEKREISHAVGIAALRFSFLRAGPNMRIVFDLDRALSLSGDSGPYVQYAYARGANIMTKAKALGEFGDATDFENYEFDTSEIALFRTMLKFEDVLEACARNFQIHPMCEYLIEMSGDFNKFYTAVRVLSEEDKNKRAVRLFEIRAYTALMARAMEIVGIEPIERM